MENKAIIFDIKRDSSYDGPGIRTTVFFKGCPLSCVWCQNPEGKSPKPSLFYDKSACRPLESGSPCTKVCKSGCLEMGGDTDVPLLIEQERCTRCDSCFELCPTGALRPVGYEIGLEELLSKTLRDKSFYRSTGGGVTVSGGEATMQMDFLHSFLSALKQEGVHTAIETSGFFDMEAFERLILPYLDLIYFDIKLIANDDESLRFTGRTAGMIRENFSRLKRVATVPVVVRVPLVPSITATEDNLKAIAKFLRAEGVETCSLMHYNPLWTGKADQLGFESEYDVLGSYMDKAKEDECLKYFHHTK